MIYSCLRHICAVIRRSGELLMYSEMTISDYSICIYMMNCSAIYCPTGDSDNVVIKTARSNQH